MTYFAGNAKPGVITASPTGQPPMASQAARICPAPARLKIAPHTPPPSQSAELAAFTIASTRMFVMSLRTI